MRFFSLLFLLLPWVATTQTNYEMDEIAQKVPSASTYSVEELAQYFVKSIREPRARVRAIFTWISLNIKYLDTSNESEIWATPEHLSRQRPDQVLLNRSAVCQGYANLFQALTSAAGMESQVVTGIVKNEDRVVVRIGHCWAAVKISGEWRLFDPTWSVPKAGSTGQVTEKYFMAAPEKFLLNHLPDDPAWQLLENPLRESDFRENDDAGIKDIIREKKGAIFNFRDTLKYWISLDSTARPFHSESRVLQFNGGNQRIVFGLGQGYFSLFYDLRAHLDTIVNRSIEQDSIWLDTSYVLAQLQLLRQYHRRARTLFAQLTEPARVAQTQTFYTEEDINATIEKIRGSMWTAAFCNHYLITKNAVNEVTLQELTTLSDSADRAFLRARTGIDCQKLTNTCYAVYHNLGLAHLLLAERYVSFTKNLLADNKADNYLKTIELDIKKAEKLYHLAEEETRQLSLVPPPFAFFKERMLSTQKGLLTLQVLAISARRIAITGQMESALNAPDNPPNTGLKTAEKMQSILNDLDHLLENIEDSFNLYGVKYGETTLFLLHMEAYFLRFNLSSLHFQIALEMQQNALGKNSFLTEKKAIEAQAHQAQRTLKEANESVAFLEKSNRLSAESIDQRYANIYQLSKDIRVFLAKF